LFDVEVDSIRSFDAETQRSIRQLDEVYIPPVTEMILPKELWEGATNRIKKAYEQTNQALEDEEAKELLGSHLMPTIEALENNEWDESFAFYTDFLYENTSSIIDYIPKEALVLYDEYPRILESNQNLEEEELAWIESQTKHHRLLKNQAFSHDF
jgi:Transcription-repair coupling factor (superfamily II helicase)